METIAVPWKPDTANSKFALVNVKIRKGLFKWDNLTNAILNKDRV